MLPRRWRLVESPIGLGAADAVERKAGAVAIERPGSSLTVTPSGGHLVREDLHHGKTASGVTPEYKDKAVKLVINTGRPVAVVALELGVKEQTLGRWVNLFKSRQDAGDDALSETERAELAWLRKENSELKMDRAF